MKLIIVNDKGSDILSTGAIIEAVGRESCECTGQIGLGCPGYVYLIKVPFQDTPVEFCGWRFRPIEISNYGRDD